MRLSLRHAAAVTGALLFVLASAQAARAADRWTQTGQSFASVYYWQGIGFDPASRSFFFDGPEQGLWRTDANLNWRAGRSVGIPAAVTAARGWNHLGDLTYDARAKRLLVPLECYYPGAPDPNTCHTGAVGVIDPTTLAWRYHVTLGGIPKAMWNEISPDGAWLWTSSGTDLVAYDAAQITAANAGATLAPAKVIPGVLRAASVTGATFLGDRLYVALDRGTYQQVLSYPVDPATGDVGAAWRLEIQRTKTSTLYESEGLAAADALGGTLHWQIQPQLPFYTRILHFVPAA